MAPRLDPAVEELLRVARDDYAASLPAKLAALRVLVSAGAWREARRAAHRLRGSAGTYGFQVLGRLATEVEGLLIDWGEHPSLATRERIVETFRLMQVEIERSYGARP